MGKVLLIQLWIGKIPDYFWYHYDTTKNIGIDFLFVTDQDIQLDSPNYKVIKTSKEEIDKKVSSMLGIDINIPNAKKTCDLKASLGHLFEEHLQGYDYFGCYDIDTLFGDITPSLVKYMNEGYDFITIGDEVFCNRLSGPLLLIKNTKELRTLYSKGNFIECMLDENLCFYEEKVLDNLAQGNYSPISIPIYRIY